MHLQGGNGVSRADSIKSATVSQHPDLGSIITLETADVLPGFPPHAIADALRRLPEEELKLALSSKILPLITLPGLRLFATFGAAALRKARAEGLKIVAEGQVADFIRASREAVGHMLLKEATYDLVRRFPSRSASVRLIAWQKAVGVAAVALLPGFILLAPTSWMIAAVSLFSGLFFLSVIALRIFCLLPASRTARVKPAAVPDAQLPSYTVLVPLFRETSVLGQLLTALTSLDYPPQLLDIKLILEESDILMQRAVAGLPLPPQFEVIVVPSGLPQTKPRALNYALPYARGELLTIFDAEDIPEPRQLRLAAGHFALLPLETACLQAELVFYNPTENWLTRMFTIEYATLFGIMLPALAQHGLPFPLGGTSNHFRTAVLRRIAAWDPFNVTEDADLGLRLARAGYQTGTIDSRTYEEANVKLLNWLRQRARWFKGFLQTWLVHMRHPPHFFREVGPTAFWAAQTMTLGVFASALLHPFFLAATAALFVFGEAMPEDAGLLRIAMAGLNLLVLLSGYVVAMIAGWRSLMHLRITGWAPRLLTVPAYWLLMSVAAWLALWQFIVAPFHWNKTEHGLSRSQRRKRHEKQHT